METLNATTALHIGGIVLIPVQHVRIEPSRRRGSVCVHALASPRAIVVGAGGAWHAFAPDGAEVALEPLLAEASGLADAVEREHLSNG